jgi:hypothetical protein
LVLIWNLPQLEVLEIEFEAEVKKKDQLVVVVDRAKRWKFPREGGSHLRWNGEVKESKWEGLAHPIEVDEEYMVVKKFRRYMPKLMLWTPATVQ